MTQKQAETFPFEFILMWIRPKEQKDLKCLFCKKEPVAYELYQFVDMRDMLAGGIDAAWMKSIRQQITGNYRPAYTQDVCVDCCTHFASIALGKRQPVQQLLSMASLARKQGGIILSQAIVCTVKSFNDEGDTWIVNAPNTSIGDVAQHIKTIKR